MGRPGQALNLPCIIQGLQTVKLRDDWGRASQSSLCMVHLKGPAKQKPAVQLVCPFAPHLCAHPQSLPAQSWSCCSAGSAPDREKVEAACSQIGGKLVAAGEERESASLGQSRFSFSFLSRNWSHGWAGEACSPSSSNGSS